jgi:hypothetical protein
MDHLSNMDGSLGVSPEKAKFEDIEIYARKKELYQRI